MKVSVYRSKINPELGFVIQEVKDEVSLWVDEYEGGEAYVTDLDFEENFKIEQDAIDYINNKWGTIELINIY
jgi:hypothetical protein